jgi:hypothetical protein
VADKIAEHAEFFSFGTNDLTQMGFGFSRDDIGGFLPTTSRRRSFRWIPSSLDQRRGPAGRDGVEKGRETRPGLKSASAASTAASRLREVLPPRRTELRELQRPSACRSPAWPPLRPPSDPAVGVRESLRRSKEMMRGHKWKLFCLYCRFIGWSLLALLTCGVGYLWLIPYMQTAMAHFYEDVRPRSTGVA